MENVIAVFILAVLIGGAAVYLVKAKRNGVKCVGCPAGGNCRGGSFCRMRRGISRPSGGKEHSGKGGRKKRIYRGFHSGNKCK